jgi:hypothetical protein
MKIEGPPVRDRTGCGAENMNKNEKANGCDS